MLEKQKNEGSKLERCIRAICIHISPDRYAGSVGSIDLLTQPTRMGGDHKCSQEDTNLGATCISRIDLRFPF